jgi:pimeloyl-ACP methyl ester carboxylesterase
MSLAYETHGSGTPVVLLHGLTFDRRSWRPIIERLGDDVHTIAIDLPGHGESQAPAADLDIVAVQVHALLEELGVGRPVMVGHSISGGLVLTYAGLYPTRGAVSIDCPFDLRAFAGLVKQLAPALRGPGFEQAFAPFQQSMRLHLLHEPVPQTIRQDVVLTYWDKLIRTDPDALQQQIEEMAARTETPALMLFGDRLPAEQREYIRAHRPGIEVEEWPGRGHMLHLVEPDRFTDRLRRFLASVAPVGALQRDALEHVGDRLARVDG